MIVLLDVDGVLARFVEGCLKFLSEKFNQPVPDRSQVLRGWITDHFPEEQANALKEHIDNYRFARDLEKVPEAEETVQRIRECGNDVYIVTAPWVTSQSWAYDRQEWLREHFGVDPKHVVFAHEKKLVQGDILIDDMPHHLTNWYRKNPVGIPILHREHNAKIPGYTSLDWSQIAALPWEADRDAVRRATPVWWRERGLV